MDLSFIRRHRATAVDLPALLARTAAMQSASPTARAQVRLESAARHFHIDDPHIEVFATDGRHETDAAQVASFADIRNDFFSPRQPN